MIFLPAGSTAFLDNPTSPTLTFVTDKNGQYVIVLTVNDGELDSLPDDVVVISATPNAPPIAYAGNDQTVSRNTMISLDGSGIMILIEDPLTYNWSIGSRPEGSTSELDDPTSPKPKILADREGDYVFRLVVYDGQLYSNPDTVVVKVVNDPPIANAGPDKDGVVGVPVSLDGSGSSDPNGDTLTYQWSIGSAPSGSGATINDPTSATPAFTPDLPGTYTIQLVVNDGWVSSAPDTVRIEVIKPNQNPVANPGGPYTGLVGITVSLMAQAQVILMVIPSPILELRRWSNRFRSQSCPYLFKSRAIHSHPNSARRPGRQHTAQTTAQIKNPVPYCRLSTLHLSLQEVLEFTLTLNGDNFLSTSIVSFNNQQFHHSIHKQNPDRGHYSFQCNSAPGNYPVKVTNPAPGGGESSILLFTVQPKEQPPETPQSGYINGRVSMLTPEVPSGCHNYLKGCDGCGL